MAALAGFGLDWLLSRPDKGRWLPRALGWIAVIAGAGSLLLVGVSMALPAPFIALGERLLNWGFWADLAKSQGFADGAMFWSYEATQIARFGLMALLSGASVLLALRFQVDETTPRRALRRLAPLLPLLVLTFDLWLMGHSFNPAVDPKLLDLTPPSVAFLQSKLDPAQPWRLTSFDDAENEKVLNANSAMRYGLEDIRGYDSIIPKQYVAYMKRLHPQGELLYNRIAPIYSELGGQRNDAALDNPLLHLLGARYVIATQPISNTGYSLVYDDEVKIYENANALPRAFIAQQAVAAPDQEAALDRLQQVDPRNVVVVEGLAESDLPPPSSPQIKEAQFSSRENREYFVDVNISDRGWLVVTDNYFDGWKAYLRPFGVSGEGMDASGQSIETQLPIYRADGTFRAVYLPEAGQWTVRFVYSPRSVLLGVYLSFLSLITLILLVGWWAWGKYYKGEGSEVGTVAKNSTVQVIMSLMNRAIDFAFAMLRLRVLSPEGEGSYVTAITFYLIAEIVTRFGLGTLLTRDVAFEKARARKYLWNVISLRTLLWLVSLPVIAVVLYFFQHSPSPLTSAEVQAIALFAAALFFANIADALSSVFMAFEKMEYPAANATAITVAKVALGGLVILPPFNAGFVGLAAVSVVMNFVQVIWLWITLEQKVLRPHEAGVATEGAQSAEARTGSGVSASSVAKRFDWPLQKYMLRESGPLMINHLLATVFWRISQLVLRAAVNPAAVGIFSAGIKYVDGLNVIPAYFTAAIFPLMSRYAQSGSEAFVKAYRLALQLLFIVALPIAVFFTFEATPLIRILGGAAYLPDSAIALRIMIWSIPIGFINSVTQYALIAVNQQRYLTRAFVVGVAFTAISNWLLVPRYGAVAAAALLIPAELSLFIPFAWAVRRYIAPMPWLSLLGRPLLATAVNVAIVWGLDRAGLPTILAVAAGFAVYAVVLFALGAFRGEEFAVLRNGLNRRLRRPAAEASP
jgi:O-antigen/teichoic acid export membrane protein